MTMLNSMLLAISWYFSLQNLLSGKKITQKLIVA